MGENKREKVFLEFISICVYSLIKSDIKVK
ncbi:hypothetical protein Cp4441_00749 [Clostridium perfringens]|nr:hypothetical protein [Clostridium perfringens]